MIRGLRKSSAAWTLNTLLGLAILQTSATSSSAAEAECSTVWEGGSAQPQPSPRYDYAHDFPWNDPSLKPQLKSSMTEPQLLTLIRRLFARAGEKLVEPPKADIPSYQEILRNSPQDFELLKSVRHRYRPAVAHGPTLINADHEFKGISDREYGLCWGFSTLVRKFHMLARYLKGPRSSVEKYEDQIDDLIAGKVVTFVGVKNFRELSLIPEVELYLKIKAMRLWASKVAHRSSFQILKQATTPMTPAQVDLLLFDLEERLARNEMPKIHFSQLIPANTILGYNTEIHVVLVYDVKRLKNGGAKIYVWDINFYAESLMRSPKTIDIGPDYSLRFKPWYEPTKKYHDKGDLLAQIGITPENDREIAQAIHALKQEAQR